jgi:spoIIIJ-associated protein
VDEKKYTVASIGAPIEGFLRTVLKDAGFDVRFEVAEGLHLHPGFEDPEVVVRFSGPDVEILLANRAEVLLALEHVTTEVLDIPAEDHSLVCFDANDYRVLRIEELRMSAVTAAEKVKKTHTPFHFNPMSSRERRIIHLSLRDETGIRSESTGTGPYRQVVILPSDMPLPEPIRPPRVFPPRDGPPRDGPSRGGPNRRPGPPRRGR